MKLCRRRTLSILKNTTSVTKILNTVRAVRIYNMCKCKDEKVTARWERGGGGGGANAEIPPCTASAFEIDQHAQHHV